MSIPYTNFFVLVRLFVYVDGALAFGSQSPVEAPLPGNFCTVARSVLDALPVIMETSSTNGDVILGVTCVTSDYGLVQDRPKEQSTHIEIRIRSGLCSIARI